MDVLGASVIKESAAMENVLIIGDEGGFAETLKAGLEALAIHEVQYAKDDLQALRILMEETISTVVMDTSSSGIDCFEIIAYLSRAHPSLPLILITGDQKPWFYDKKGKTGAVYHLQKPLDIGGLASAIFIGLKLKDAPENSRGMTVGALLPLIEKKRRTCRMEVAAENEGKGYLYFTDGVLVDAHLEGFRSEEAAREISRWEKVAIRFGELPERRVRSRVSAPLMDLAGADWRSQAAVSAALDIVETSPSPGLPEKKPTCPNASIEEEVLRQHRDALRKIEGCVGLVIVDLLGNPLAKDILDGEFDLEHLATVMGLILPEFSGKMEKHGLGTVSEITVSSPRGVLCILQPAESLKNDYRIAGLVKPDGDLAALQSSMQKIFQALRELNLRNTE